MLKTGTQAAVMFLLGILVYSLMGFAWVDSKLKDYIRSDVFVLLCQRLDRIESKIDNVDNKLSEHSKRH